MNLKDYKSCVDACLQCAVVCDYCANMDLKEKDTAMLAKCAQLDMECSTVCYAAAKLMSLGSEKSKELCKLCADICIQCAEECEKHDHAHCKECAAECRKCADACRKMHGLS